MTYISRAGSSFEETPGKLFTYEITESNNVFTFTLKNIFSPLLSEDVYWASTTNYICPTGYQFANFNPYSNEGLILVEDRRLTPTYKTRFYRLSYDNDISVDYTGY